VDVIGIFFLVVLVIAALGATRLGAYASAAAAVVTVLLIGLISWVVFSEDGYVNDGGSKWAHRGSGAHDLYIVAVVGGCLLAAMYTVLAVRRVRGPAVSAAVVAGGILEAFGVLAIALAFSSN
jgi:hypothetical protein